MKQLTASALTLGMLTLSTPALACPYCLGMESSTNNNYTLWILGIFILALYIPFYLIFKTIIKNRRPSWRDTK